MRTPSLVLALLTAAACAELPAPSPLPEDLDNPAFPRFPERPAQPPAVQRATLTTFGGATACADLEQHLEDRAVTEMRVRLEQNRRWALEYWQWQADGGGSWGSADSGSAAGGGSGGGNGTSGGPSEFTTTNLQEAAVDEPDFVKNDGTRLFVLSGRRLYTLSTWPATALATRGSLELPGRPLEMFLDGSRVLVFSGVFDRTFDPPSWCAQNPSCDDWYVNTVLVTHVDVSDLANPRVTATQRVPGRYESARRVGDVVRMVTTARFPFVDDLPTWIDWERRDRAGSLAALSALFDQLLVDNAARIRARTLSQWLSTPLLTAGGTTQQATLDCTRVWTTTASAQLGLTSVVSLDLSNPLAFSRQALLATVDELYQGDSLWLGQRQWWWSSTSTDDATYLYRFDLSQPDEVHFVAAGRVDGMPLNQFALDEHQGVLRVATTDWVEGWRTINRVVTLGTQGDALVELGRTPDLAPGERIMSARFFDDRAYVVTFRSIDPLYVVDLANPAAPQVVGELKVPGFSSYLHPLDATHLLTIGTYIPEPPASWTRHLQLQIFDVSNPAAPQQTHRELVGEAYGWSQAQWDHKAFNFFSARGTLAIPFADYTQDATTGQWSLVSDLRVYRVSPQTGFTSLGRMNMADVVSSECEGWGCWTWWWQPNVRRSVMADDFVYAISSGGVRVARVDALEAPLATARFQPAP